VEFSNSNRYTFEPVFDDRVGPRNMDCGSLLEELTPDPERPVSTGHSEDKARGC
jgi:hypothetical protein